MGLDPACRYVIYRCNHKGRNCGATKWQDIWERGDMGRTPSLCPHGAWAEDDWETQRRIDAADKERAWEGR